MTDGPLPDTDWIVEFTGLDIDGALALAQSQGRTARVLRPGDAMTMDYRPDRLNLYLDDAGVLSDVRAG